MTEAPLFTILSGIVGSSAYGLATPESDIDRMGIFVAPTVDFHGLHKPPETHVFTEPDMTFHEAAKWCRLALNGNPSVMELLWLEQYEKIDSHGADLLDIRKSFLSSIHVRNAYLGYAGQQFARLRKRGDGTFSSDTRKRTAKHARHLWRLCEQGLHLYSAGELQIRLKRPELCFEFGERIASGDIEVARTLLAEYEYAFDNTVSPLPMLPDTSEAEAWCRGVRRWYLFE